VDQEDKGVPSRRAATAVAMLCLAAIGCAVASGCSGTPSDQVPASTKEVSFVVDGTTTYGSLQIPAHRRGRHLAAALLLAGSGATDRDGNQKPDLTPNTLRQIADALAGVGVMSLRFDKYFAGKTGAGSYASDPGSIDLDTFIRQAAAAYKLLAGQRSVDRQRLLVVGHSEGGMYAILLAETVSPRPAGLALVEPQDEHLLDLLAVQINETLDAQVAQGTITADTARQNARAVKQAIDQFRAGQPVDTSRLLPSVVGTLTPLILTPASARYARTDDAVDVAAAAAKLPSGTRVLVTDGTQDFNVPPFTIQPLVDGLAAAATTGPGLRTLSGLDHYLEPAGTEPNGATLDIGFLTALRTWAQPYTAAP
jgi:poly(3-hydroxybutyrate) depolymerase